MLRIFYYKGRLEGHKKYNDQLLTQIYLLMKGADQLKFF